MAAVKRKKKAVLPKLLTDVEALELIYGPPAEILKSERLRGYQVWMKNKIVDLDGVFLAAEMGLGKTAAVLKAIVELMAAGEIRKVLIVAPLRVAEETWPEEIAKWDFARHLTYRVVTGDAEQRKAALAFGPCDITIINRENLDWLCKTVGMRRWPFDMFVYDEPRIKSGRKRSKPRARQDGSVAHKRLTDLGRIQWCRHRTKKIVELSGTPSPNGLIDLWGPIYAIDGGKRLGASITAFRERWFQYDPYKRTYTPFDHSYDEIMTAIDDVFFSLREEDYLKLPPMIPVDHKVRLSPREMERYRQFEHDMGIEVQNRAGETEVIEAVNRGVLTGKLLQFANGSLYLGDKFDEETGGKLPRESVRIHDRKLDVLDSIMNEAAGAPVLVAYSFQFDKEAIRKRFPYARFFGESQSDMRDWNAGRIKMLVTHPASAGHGLNFQHGSNIAVWYGLTWSLELYRQFVKRLHRSGQKADRVFLHRIIARDTMDETMLPLLTTKGMTQDRITDAVRVRLGEAASDVRHRRAA